MGSDHVHWAAFGWGAAAATVAPTVDGAWTGRRDPLTIERWWLVPPLVVGSVTAAAGVVVGLYGPLAALWPLALAAAAWTAVMSYLLRAEPLLVVSLSLATLAYTSVLDAAGRDVIAEPVLLTWPSLVLLGLSLVAPRSGKLGRPDVPALAVGLVVACLALATGFAAGATNGTWAPIGAMLIILGVAKREWLVLAGAGSVLLIAAGAFAGPWWLTCALAAHAAAFAVVARVVDPATAAPVQWASAVFGGAAWAAALWAVEATAGVALATTSAATSAVAILATFSVWRRPHLGHQATWTAPWAAVALVGLSVSVVAGLDAGVGTGARWAVAAAASVWSVAAVHAGTTLGRAELRFLASVTLLCVVAATGWAADLTTTGWATLVLASAVALTSAGAVASGTVVRSGWARWLVADAALLHAGGVGIAALLLPERTMLVLALLAAAGAAVAVDLLIDVRGARYFAPGLVFGAWLAFITEAAATGNVQWYVPPFALAVLVDLEMVRQRRRRDGRTPLSTEDMAVAELVAIALLVGPSFVQIVVESVGYGLAAIAWGTLVAAWGAATHVRRRLGAGAIAAAVGAVLMVAVPVAQLLPEFRGPALWAAVFVIGAALITVAATLEQTKRRLGEVKSTFGRMTAGWE